jgi:predicted O-methyltransferase YrrM
LEAQKKMLKSLMGKYWDEYCALPRYAKNSDLGFGLGCPELDLMILFMMIRELKPKRYLEVGSGLSTYYCSLAAQANVSSTGDLKIICIEPYPFERLHSVKGIELIQSEVQDVNKDLFRELEEGDVLFIDSSHVVKIDGDVPFIFLEILPVLKNGVIIHVHDIPFPFNSPYPPEQWVLGQRASSPPWPMYWNEAMLLQAFLAFNSSYEILLSTPLIRHFEEQFLKNTVPIYKSINEQPDTFSSIWLKKTH